MMRDFAGMFALIVVGVLAGAWLHECSRPAMRRGLRGGMVSDTVTFFDTVYCRMPEAKQERMAGTLKISLPASGPGQADSKSGQADITLGQAEITDSARDGIEMEIPIVQREYEGEDYHAWISGYEPRLDSIFVFGRRDVVSTEIYKGREPPDRQKRWGIGVFAGYGMTPHGFQPCAGISINYNLWNF